MLMESVNKIRIQLATEPDVKYIVEIVRKSFDQYCKAIGINTIEALQESEQDVLDDMLYKHVYLAYWDAELVGSMRLEMKKEKAVLSRFAILPDYQGLGIGRVLLSFAEKTAASLGIGSIELYSAVENTKLRYLYTSQGYRIASIDDSKGYQRGLFQKSIGLEASR
jgi:GNAT superfamily N-acetyltransferase